MTMPNKWSSMRPRESSQLDQRCNFCSVGHCPSRLLRDWGPKIYEQLRIYLLVNTSKVNRPVKKITCTTLELPLPRQREVLHGTASSHPARDALHGTSAPGLLQFFLLHVHRHTDSRLPTWSDMPADRSATLLLRLRLPRAACQSPVRVPSWTLRGAPLLFSEPIPVCETLAPLPARRRSRSAPGNNGAAERETRSNR